MSYSTDTSSTSMYQRLKALSGDTHGLITTAGNELGLPEGQALKVGMIESGLKADASSGVAKGLFQFTKTTWDAMKQKYGAEYGIDPTASRTDPVANTILGVAYLKENATNYQSTFGKDPELVDLYMGHFLGQAGRNQFLKAMEQNPNAPAYAVVGKRSVANNKDVFFKKDGTARTLNEVYQMYSNKLSATELEQDMKTDRLKMDIQDELLWKTLGRSQDGSDNATLSTGTAPSTPNFDISLSDTKPQSIADALGSYGLQKPEDTVEKDERSFFDGAWEAAKAEIRLSPIGRDLREKYIQSGAPVEWDSAAAALRESFSGLSQSEMFTGNINPLEPMDITPEMWNTILSNGVDKKWMEYIKMSANPQDLVNRVQMAQEMQRADQARQAAATGGQLVGGIAGAFGDPLTFATGGTSAGGSLMTRLFVAGTEAAAGNAANEFSLSQETRGGVETNIAAAALGGFAGGVALRGLGEAFTNMSAAGRMRARQESIDAGVPDVTARPDVEVPEGKTWVEKPDESGAVVDELGNTHSATSFGNPKVMEAVEANKGIELGGLNSISYDLLRSESTETRTIAQDLVRSPTGIKGGGSGVTRMTAEDYLGRLEGQDNLIYTQAMKAREKAYEHSMFDLQGGRNAREAMERQVVEAIESGDFSRLTPEMKEYADLLTTNFTEKHYAASNIAALSGNADAPNVLTSTIDPKRYVPAIYEEGKVIDAKMRFDPEGKYEGLYNEIQSNWTAQWKNNHNGVRERMKALFDEDNSKFAEDLRAKLTKDKELDVVPEGKQKSARMEKQEGIQSKINKAEELRQKNATKLQKARKPETRAKYEGLVQRYDKQLSELKTELEMTKPMDEDKLLEIYAQRYIERKSYGIAKNGEFTHSSSLEDVDLSDSLVGIENNNFTQERNIFDMAYESIAKDGEPFSLNDLRHFDMMNAMSMYNKRMNGDIAIHASTGKTTKDLKDAIVALPEGRDRTNLDQLTRLITGRRRAEDPASALVTAIRGLQDWSFLSNSAQMWVNNLTEVSGWATNRMMFVARNGVKGLNQLLNPETKFSKADLKDFADGLFGYDLNTALLPSYRNIKDQLIKTGASERAASIAAGIRTSGALAASHKYNIYTKLLNKTTEGLVNMARSGVLSDITHEAFGGVRINKAILKNASITEKQYAGVLDMLRQHIKVQDGKYVPDVQAIKRDVRSNDLWRLADYIASDSVMRTNKVGFNYVAKPNAFMNLALQFKSFMLKGLNARTVRMWHESFQGKSIDNAMRVIVGAGITGAIWSAQAHYRSIGIPPEQRQEYLERMLDPSMVAYQAFSRSAEMGTVLGGVNLALTPFTNSDLFRLGRSTVDPVRAMKGRSPLRADVLNQQAVGEQLGDAVYNTMPALKFIGTAGVLPANAVQWALADHGYQSDMQARTFFENLASAAPNAPEIQWLIGMMAQDAGASGKGMW